MGRVTTVALLLCLLLTACGVRVEIATPVSISPTPRPLPYWNFSGDGVYRVQARPRLSFSQSERGRAQLFMQRGLPDVFLLQYRQLWLGAEYDATWFDTLQGTATIRISAFIRYDSTGAWQPYDSVEQVLSPTNPNDFRQNTLALTVYAEGPGSFEVRTEVSVITYPTDGDSSALTEFNEFRVFVLNDPGEISTDPSGLNLPFGTLDVADLLLDWRLWAGSPCDLLPFAEEDSSYETLIGACETLAEENPVEAVTLLVEAANKTQNVNLRAAYAVTAGYLAFVLDDLATSGAAFATAAAAYVELSGAWELSITLNNAAMTVAMLGDENDAFNALIQLQELRGQFYDEAGIMLTQANTTFLSNDYGGLEETYWYFRNAELPQSEIVDAWLRQLENS